MGDHAQGNYVLYTNRNTILNAPFVLEQGCTSHDIEKDKSYLIKNQKLPFQDWARRCALWEIGFSHTEGPVWAIHPLMFFLLLLTGKSREILQDSSVYRYDGF